jgi:hypothetical protein
MIQLVGTPWGARPVLKNEELFLHSHGARVAADLAVLVNEAVLVHDPIGRKPWGLGQCKKRGICSSFPQ